MKLIIRFLKIFCLRFKIGHSRESWKTFLKMLEKYLISLRIFILPDILQAYFIG